MALTVNSATAGNGDLSISSTGNLTLLGNVSSNSNVTLTATDGTLTTNGSVSISADSLTITAEQIGSTNDVIQTSATTINATANYGGIYLSNNNSGNLTLSAAAVGPILSSGQTNNIDNLQQGQYRPSPADDQSDRAGHYATRSGLQSGRSTHTFGGRNAER